MTEPDWVLFADARQLASQAAQYILQRADCLLAHEAVFRLVLAGGRTPEQVYHQLAGADQDWTRWQWYFGDERCLPPGHAGRNSQMARRCWFEPAAVPEQNIFPMAAELGAEQAAKDYARVILQGQPLHLVLLGLGEDGHTASLFPGHEHDERQWVVAVHNAPKPPPDRVSLNYPALDAAKEVLFLVTGRGKRDAVARWLQGEGLPASRIRPAGSLKVFIDVEAWPGWLVYVIRCSDGSLYTGITNDLERRFRQHSQGQGARYFNGRQPVEVVWVEACADRAQASRREAEIKALTRAQKLALIQSAGWRGAPQLRQ